MAAGGVALGAGVLAELGAPEALAAILAFPGWVALTIMVAVARFAADVPYASATLDPPSNIVAALGVSEPWQRWSGGAVGREGHRAVRRRPSRRRCPAGSPRNTPVQLGGRARPGSRSLPWRRRSS